MTGCLDYGVELIEHVRAHKHTQTVVWYVEEEFLMAEHLVSGTRWYKWVGVRVGVGVWAGWAEPPTPSPSYRHHSKSDPTPLLGDG